MAATSVAVTNVVGDLIIIRSRCGSSRKPSKPAQNQIGFKKNELNTYAGMGMPAPSLLDSTVRVTIRQSDSEAIASEAATASLSRVDATANAGLVKPTGPEDRVMVLNPLRLR
jgi:hypothetical protein